MASEAKEKMKEMNVFFQSISEVLAVATLFNHKKTAHQLEIFDFIKSAIRPARSDRRPM